MNRMGKAGWRVARAWFSTSGGQAVVGGGVLSGAREQWRRLAAFLRMIRAWSVGRYKDVSAGTLIFSGLAVVYFLSPIDLITDFLPVIGWVDDVSVLLLVLSAIGRDLDRFRAWEESQGRVIEVKNPASAVS